MDRFKTSVLTFPLVEGHTRVSDALEQTDLHSIDAVVSTNGKAFWLHNKPDLVKAAKKNPSKTLGEFQKNKLSVLGATEVGKLGPDLTSLKEAQVRKYFPTPDIDAVVMSVISNVAGDRMVVALANPDGTFKIASKVWVCPHPNGGERYRSPGVCSVHGVKLVPGS